MTSLRREVIPMTSARPRRDALLARREVIPMTSRLAARPRRDALLARREARPTTLRLATRPRREARPVSSLLAAPRHIWLALSLLALLLALPRPVRAADPPAVATTTRRVALVVGINDGGPERVKLRYAGSDARALARVLGDLGGVDRGDRIVLLEPTPEDLLAGFARASARVQAARSAGERVQFVFYYSGHADDRGLLLGGRRLDYARLRAQIDAVPAQVRLGLLDSCSSGAFVRAKGGRMRPPLATGDASVEGHAFLTSSSAEEAAQESDRIGGSYFTHYLVSGLRGAADVNRDRRVTLHEAYRFAFDETLAGTETTPGRAQHPAYDIQLVGSGDLVLTDLRETTAVLDIGATVGGRVYVRDARGDLAAELYKGVGAGPVLLALEPGTYQITVDDGRTLHRARVDVRPGKRAELTAADLAPISPEPTTSRGDAPLSGEYRLIPVSLGLVPPITINHLEKRRKVINYAGLNLILGRAHKLRGFELSFVGNWTVEDMTGLQISPGANVVGRDVRGVQFTAGANVVLGRVRALQIAGAANYARGPAHGLHLAAGANLARSLHGMQLAFGLNWAAAATGLQFGSINLAGETAGAQLGIININRGRVRGAQVGVINYADEADASVGVLGITRKGGVWLDAWTSDVAAINLAIKLRAKYTYTFLAAGVHPGGQGRGVMFGLGFGGSIPLAHRLRLELDLSSHVVHPRFDFREPPALLTTFRLLLGYQIARRFAVFGGPTVNAQLDFTDLRPRLGYAYTSFARVYPSDPNVLLQVWPGFALGFQI
jgi:hypothetical protein